MSYFNGYKAAANYKLMYCLVVFARYLAQLGGYLSQCDKLQSTTTKTNPFQRLVLLY